jgi:CheY-like chemotaxis protein
MKKILIVDDDASVLEVLSEFFTLKGFQTIEAENGQIGLNKYESEKPDLAIIDVQMPVMNGLDLSRSILDKEANFPILIVTAYLQEYPKEDILKIGVRKVYQKPVDLVDLYNSVNEILA